MIRGTGIQDITTVDIIPTPIPGITDTGMIITADGTQVTITGTIRIIPSHRDREECMKTDSACSVSVRDATRLREQRADPPPGLHLFPGEVASPAR